MRKLWRALFSRYFISAALILCELATIIYLIVSASTYSVLGFGICATVNILAVFSLVNRDANPEFKVSWLVVVILLPFFGIVLYFIFYSRRESKKKGALMAEIYASFENRNTVEKGNQIRKSGERVELNKEIMEHDKSFSALRKENFGAAGKALAIMEDDPLAEVYTNTGSRYFESGEEMFSAMLSDIEGAEKFIFLEYFIIAEGKMWDSIHSRLVSKVKEGVEVRVLYDDIGCMRTLSSGFCKQLSREGIKCMRFSPVSPRVSGVHNNRDHRKILIVDGKVAYTGGINIADEYINEKTRFGHWKDGGIRIAGMAVGGFLKLFLSIWDYNSGKASDPHQYFVGVTGDEGCDAGFYIPFGAGPAPIYERPAGKNAFLNIINQAEKYVFITTPYLIIDYDLTEALCNAAKRGVDVRIITPGIPDKKIVKLMTKSSYPYLIRHGVRVFEYVPGFIHEKTVISDDIYGVVGTINFDYRSLAHHFENALWMFGTETIVDIKEAFLRTASLSDEKDGEDAKLSPGERVLRNFVRIFAPLL